MSDNPIAPHHSGAAAIEFESDRALPDVAAAVAQLQSAIKDMRCDDLIVEFTNQQDGDGRSKSHFRLRAYRNRS
jgi:hypothetical protein